MFTQFLEFVTTVMIVVVCFFIPIPGHRPVSYLARVAIFALPVLLFLVSQYLWATTGRDLPQRVTCFFAPGSLSCRPALVAKEPDSQGEEKPQTAPHPVETPPAESQSSTQPQMLPAT